MGIVGLHVGSKRQMNATVLLMLMSVDLKKKKSTINSNKKDIFTFTAVMFLVISSHYLQFFKSCSYSWLNILFFLRFLSQLYAIFSNFQLILLYLLLVDMLLESTASEFTLIF